MSKAYRNVVKLNGLAVNVKEYGATGDGVTDDTLAFQNAISNNAFVVVPETANHYVINDTINVPAGHIVWGLGKPTLVANCSRKDAPAPASEGRNCFKLNSFSQLHNFKLNCFNNLFTSPPDGQYHAAISIGAPWVGSGNTDTLKEHIVVKNIDIESTGTANMHAVDCWGWVERCIFENLTATGRLNFVFVQHWSTDTSVLQSHLTSKSWHPAHIVWRDCVANATIAGSRGFRVSGSAWIRFENCVAYTDTGFDSFCGDRGGFYAQNIAGADVLAGIEYISCKSINAGQVAFGISGNGNQGNVATPTNLIWYGGNFNSSITMRDCRVVVDAAGKDPDPMVATFIDKIDIDGCEIRNSNASTNYGIVCSYSNSTHITNTQINNTQGILLRANNSVAIANSTIESLDPDYSKTTTGIAMGSYQYGLQLASALTAGDETLTINAIPKTTVSSITAAASTNTLTKTAHGFTDGQVVKFTELAPVTGGGLSTSLRYYVIGATANTFQVSEESGGSAVDVLTDYSSITAVTEAFVLTKGSKITTVGASTFDENVIEVLNTVTFEDETGPLTVNIKPSPISVASGTNVTAYLPVNNVTVSGCLIGGFKYGIRSGGANPNYNWTISDTNFNSMGIYAIDINNCQNIVVDGCTFSRCNYDASTSNYVIRFGQHCRNANASNNIFHENFKARYIIYLHPDVTGGVIAANVFRTPPHDGAGTDAAILLDPSYTNTQWPVISDNFYGPLITRPWYGATTTHPAQVVIASGAITVLGSTAPPLVLIDTEASAATDDLDTINGGLEGQIIVCSSFNNGRDVTFKDGTGNLRLAGDFTSTVTSDLITLIRRGANWWELSRSDNG